MSKAVTKVRTLEDCEAIIDENLKGFWLIGEAYLEIQRMNLYRKTHKTWEAYCLDRWGLKVDTVGEAIRAFKVRKQLAEATGDVPGRLPVNTTQALTLNPLNKRERREAWEEALEVADSRGIEQPTVEDLRRIVRKRRNYPLQPINLIPEAGDLAHRSAQRMRDNADRFQISVLKLMDHIPNLTESEGQGCAYKVVETVNVVLDILQKNGHITSDVVRGLVSQPEEGMVEVGKPS